jgi:hypothetical protein
VRGDDLSAWLSAASAHVIADGADEPGSDELREPYQLRDEGQDAFVQFAELNGTS